jgi:Fic family protein/plasmid maintenance system antidote protein VapI
MNKLTNILKTERLKNQLLTREVASKLGIDQALVSKFENGSRLPTKKQVLQLAQLFNVEERELMVPWLANKVLQTLEYEDYAIEALQVAEDTMAYIDKNKPSTLNKDAEDLLNQIGELKKKLNEYRHLDSYRVAEALELEYTFESNRIEGNTLTLMETNLVVNEGLTISGKSMREHLEAINHSHAIEFIKDLVAKKTSITEGILLQIHKLILHGIDNDYAGKYRNVQVIINGSKHIPPAPYLVAKQMEDYFIWYNQNKNKLHPVVLAAEMHERLVTIHPFIDGNGRTSRLVMNLILLQHGFVIANIKGDGNSRKEYYTALENTRVNDTTQSFINFILKVEILSLENYIHILGR